MLNWQRNRLRIETRENASGRKIRWLVVSARTLDGTEHYYELRCGRVEEPDTETRLRGGLAFWITRLYDAFKEDIYPIHQERTPEEQAWVEESRRRMEWPENAVGG